jgi:hypothetical protein
MGHRRQGLAQERRKGAARYPNGLADRQPSRSRFPKLPRTRTRKGVAERAKEKCPHSAPHRATPCVRRHRTSTLPPRPLDGRPEEWVRRRTGHTSSAFERYRRVAATLRELTAGDWTPLDLAIPEIVAAAGAGLSGSRPKKSDLRNREILNGSAWSGRLDSNQRPLDPQSSALTRLRYAPNHPSRVCRPEE